VGLLVVHLTCWCYFLLLNLGVLGILPSESGFVQLDACTLLAPPTQVFRFLFDYYDTLLSRSVKPGPRYVRFLLQMC
jgi:hypothetical protein